MSGDLLFGSVQRIWSEMLPLISHKGWRYTEQELYRRIRLARSGMAFLGQVEALSLVLATLQQKFGHLTASVSVLKTIPTTDENVALRDVILSRIAAQRGRFPEAYKLNDALISLLGGKKDSSWNELPPALGPISVLGSTPSVAWRAALAAGLASEPQQSEYWFRAHSEMASGRHGSQLANNRVFRAAVELVRGGVDLDSIHIASKAALEGYLRDGLTTTGVLFINIAKSVVLPMILESAILFEAKQLHDALVQAVLVRRLLQWEQVSPDAEGIAELRFALGRLRSTFLRDIVSRSHQPEDQFVMWLSRRTDPAVAARVVAEAELRFALFSRSGNYRELIIVDDVFPSVGRAVQRRTVYFIWRANEAVGYKISNFLMGALGANVIGFGVVDNGGRLLRSEVLRLVGEATAVLIHWSPDADYEIGIVHGSTPLSKIVYLSTDADPGLEFPSIVIDSTNPAAKFERIRKSLESIWDS
ncbi:hypothetical protein [Actinoplanes sp. NBRC 103695]|uniref:hypothetical protein n=1 Tax=Actinoplanes sp. NBRC 103695 TaxID=3032202 RepID=UPI00249F9A9E|nr:hypothetical protein [Actinoplanes sp. NBRC 103695]GLY95359.1 hypothetical protein Acsp02_26140 [Actinoplanes sp. NBRC 103695]